MLINFKSFEKSVIHAQLVILLGLYPAKLLYIFSESLKLKLLVFSRLNSNKSIKNLTHSPSDDVFIQNNNNLAYKNLIITRPSSSCYYIPLISALN